MSWDILPKANLQYFLQKLKGKLDAIRQGHVIKNSSGTSMTSRDDLKFSGYLKTTDDSTNACTVISDEPIPISWASYQALTDVQRSGNKYFITDYPGGGSQGSGGHVIIADGGTSLPQEDNLQFGGVYVHDDSTNGKTKVDVVREFQSAAEIEALTGEAAKGFQHTPDTVYRGRTASDIGFDKTGTSFNSTRVQDVLEEVDGKIDDVSTPIDITSQITFNETYIDTSGTNTMVNVIKMGKMVVVTISGLTLKQALSGSTTFISNLPIPKFDINIGLTNPISGQTSNDGWNTSRCRLRDTGELKIWFDNIPQNSVPFGQFTYFTN